MKEKWTYVGIGIIIAVIAMGILQQGPVNAQTTSGAKRFEFVTFRGPTLTGTAYSEWATVLDTETGTVNLLNSKDIGTANPPDVYPFLTTAP